MTRILLRWLWLYCTKLLRDYCVLLVRPLRHYCRCSVREGQSAGDPGITRCESTAEGSAPNPSLCFDASVTCYIFW